jgi:hypothetical protein
MERLLQVWPRLRSDLCPFSCYSDGCYDSDSAVHKGNGKSAFRWRNRHEPGDPFARATHHGAGCYNTKYRGDHIDTAPATASASATTGAVAWLSGYPFNRTIVSSVTSI